LSPPGDLKRTSQKEGRAIRASSRCISTANFSLPQPRAIQIAMFAGGFARGCLFWQIVSAAHSLSARGFAEILIFINVVTRIFLLWKWRGPWNLP
jgi:hypothetical protein